MSPRKAEPVSQTPDTEPVARFESAMKELEEIVTRMESGELSLEETLRLYERGDALTRDCKTALEAAELRLKQLTAGGEEPRE